MLVKPLIFCRQNGIYHGFRYLIDGHDIPSILNALDAARACTDKPTVVVAKTVKGKGVSIFENKVEWHGKAPNDKHLAVAMRDLGEAGEPST